MNHWINNYIGCHWTDEHDCFWWFRLIQKSQFGRDVLPCLTLSERLREFRCWNAVTGSNYKEGDAVWMTQQNEPHHIGVWSGLGVLHAVQGQGVIHDTIPQLTMQGWKIKRVDTYA